MFGLRGKAPSQLDSEESKVAPLKSVLDGMTAAITADVAVAAVAFDARTTLVKGLEVDVSAGRHAFKVDEPEVLGGTDLGPNPVQLILGALGACQAITYQVWAAKLGIVLEGFEARVEGDLDLRGFFGIDDVTRPGFQAVRVFVTIEGPEPPERYEELVQAVNAHCPVLDIVGNGVPVNVEVKVA